MDTKFHRKDSTLKKNTITILSSLGMLITTAIWGFAFVVVKDTVDKVPPVYMMAFRFTIAAVGLTLICARRIKKLNPSILLHGGIIGVCLFLAYLLQTVGIQYTTAGKNAFLTTVYVIFVPLILWIATRRFHRFCYGYGGSGAADSTGQPANEQGRCNELVVWLILCLADYLYCPLQCHRRCHPFDHSAAGSSGTAVLDFSPLL